MMKLRCLLSVLCIAAAVFADVEVSSPGIVELEKLPPLEFLREIRKPLRIEAWGEFTGRIACKGSGKNLKGELRVRITFTENSMHTQAVLNDRNVYTLEQKHQEGGKVAAAVQRPVVEESPGLFDFGIDPEDLAFAFIYWDFIEEKPRQSSRLRECRVMRLSDPNGNGTVEVWFHANHGFPMEAWWYEDGQIEPWRKLQLKGAKRHENGLWFVREMRLEGKDWKTQVKFDHVELNQVGN